MSELSDAEERFSRLDADGRAGRGDAWSEVYWSTGPWDDAYDRWEKDRDAILRAHLATIQRARIEISPERLKEVGASEDDLSKFGGGIEYRWEFDECFLSCHEGRWTIGRRGDKTVEGLQVTREVIPPPDHMADVDALIARLARNTKRGE